MDGRRAGWILWMSALALVAACRSAPVTERKQLLLVPESQEVALGRSAFQQILDETPLSPNVRYQQLVQRIGQRIAMVANRPDFEWEFRVFASPEQNAFCLPGGKVGVYEGIIALCRNEAELAVVMSHEVAHALQRHGGERMSHAYVSQALENAIRYATQNRDRLARDRLLAAYGLASEYGAILPFSRKHELEADHVGLILMAQAGYDPTVAPGFWERFSRVGGAKPPEFLSTHPSDLHRAEALRDLLPEVARIYRGVAQPWGLGESLHPAATAATPEPPADVDHPPRPRR